MNSMTARVLVVAGCLLTVGVALARAGRTEPTVARDPLSACPVEISDWSGQNAEAFDEKVLAVLGVDEYLHRVYVNRRGAAVGLYIGYYRSQREGDTIHSPMNCLPGGGWIPAETTRIQVPVRDADSAPQTIEVNRLVIREGARSTTRDSIGTRLMAAWSPARTWNKIYMVLDALRTNRTDGAMVRIIVPIADSADDAEREAIDFVQSIFPMLSRYCPPDTPRSLTTCYAAHLFDALQG